MMKLLLPCSSPFSVRGDAARLGRRQLRTGHRSIRSYQLSLIFFERVTRMPGGAGTAIRYRTVSKPVVRNSEVPADTIPPWCCNTKLLRRLYCRSVRYRCGQGEIFPVFISQSQGVTEWLLHLASPQSSCSSGSLGDKWSIYLGDFSRIIRCSVTGAASNAEMTRRSDII